VAVKMLDLSFEAEKSLLQRDVYTRLEIVAMALEP
jgi:hypothetical protein